IAAKLGMNIAAVEFPERYNGNIRVLLGQGLEDVQAQVDESGFIAAFRGMNKYISDYSSKIRMRLSDLTRKNGALPAKSFPGRASILINFCEIDEGTLSAAYERPGSPKIGNYIPGTRIPILDESEFFSHPEQPVLVNLAWHIRQEIHEYMRRKGFTGEIV